MSGKLYSYICAACHDKERPIYRQLKAWRKQYHPECLKTLPCAECGQRHRYGKDRLCYPCRKAKTERNAVRRTQTEAQDDDYPTTWPIKGLPELQYQRFKLSIRVGGAAREIRQASNEC